VTLGSTVDNKLGIINGSAEGAAVDGEDEGINDGDDVGSADGATVDGFDDGSADGADVGAAD
jgi:hypothetical protein